ncbi:MAG: glucose-6-phosphate dehydrogenase [Sedimentisphaerales bacterium]|jgi:glucose-6-phosphate 1-dehydrogenase
MSDISPTLLPQEIACAEIKASACGMVVFGASGDLVRRKLLGSIFELFRRDLLNENFYLVGCGRSSFSDEQYRADAQEAVRASLGSVQAELLKRFTEKLYYITGEYEDEAFYKSIAERLARLNEVHNVSGSHIYYMAVPPLLYGTIVKGLKSAGLSCAGLPECEKIRLVVEKPFGRDLKSADELNRIIQTCFSERQIYRIDHYLGKETVQNILMFRFANTIFEPVWNRNFIDHIQITIAESVGVEHRGGYYDKAGTLRDMFQNHMLGMLALVAMEPPVLFDADHVRDEKVKLLECIRPLNEQNASTDFVRGQYTAGKVDGVIVPAYRQEPKVDSASTTETFVAARLFVDNWRWQDVPFYLRTGKRLAKKNTEIAITFKKVPHSMFASVGLIDLPANTLVIQIQPQEGLSLSFQAKRPGSKVCIGTLRMKFNYAEVFGGEPPEAYERLLLDCMLGDQTLFTRQDDVEVSWKLLEPVLQQWTGAKSMPYEYRAGSESFPQADRLIESDGRKWRPLSEM